MKKLMLLLTLAGFCSTIIAEGMVSSALNPDLIICIRINLHKRPDCVSGFGFCRISINRQMDDGPGFSSKDLLAEAYLNSSNALVIKIAESALREYESGKSLGYFLGKDKIVLIESYEIDETVGKALGATSPLVIKAGEYKVINDRGYFLVVFPQ